MRYLSFICVFCFLCLPCLFYISRSSLINCGSPEVETLFIGVWKPLSCDALGFCTRPWSDLKTSSSWSRSKASGVVFPEFASSDSLGESSAE